MQGGVDTIKPYVDEFIRFAKENTHVIFLVTRIGCGIAGFKDSEIGLLFKEAIDVDNIYLPKEFVECINNSGVDSFNLQRFLDAQDLDYEQALKEIKNGQKRTHWIWYIFPQLASLGHSYNAKYYGISGYDEAAAYLAHPVLNEHLRTITKALLWHKMCKIEDIMGKIDAIKLCSCMTLFDAVSPNDIFGIVLIEFYDGVRDKTTLQILRNIK